MQGLVFLAANFPAKILEGVSIWRSFPEVITITGKTLLVIWLRILDVQEQN